MRFLEQWTLAWQAFRHTLPRLFQPRLWLWAVPLAGCQLLVIVLLAGAAHPLVSTFMAPLLVRLAGPGALHYPRLFEILPGLFDRADAILGAVVGSVVFGAATPAFAESFRGETVHARAALRAAFERAPRLILALLPFNLLLFAIDFAAGHVLGPLLAGRSIARLLPLAATGASLCVQAAFFYAVALVVLEGRDVRSTLRALPSTWKPGFVAALLVSVAAFALWNIARLPMISPALLVDRGIPELTGWLTVAHAVAGLVNGFVLTGAATLLYLIAVAPERRQA